MIFHFELPKPKRVGGLEQAVYDIVRALNAYTRQTHARIGDYFPDHLRGVQAVHFHGIWDGEHIRAARRCSALNIPYVVSPHGMLEPWPLRHKRLKKWVHRTLFTDRYLKGAQFLLATSEMEAEHLRRLYPDQRVHALPLGIGDIPAVDHKAARQHIEVPPERCLLLFLSRVDTKKNLHGLLEALLLLPEATQQTLALAIVGEGTGNYFQRCHELAHACRKKHIDVRWMGPIWGDEKWQWLAGADLFAVPSKSENFGYVYLESLATGTPILTTEHTPWGRSPEPTATEVCGTTPRQIAEGLNRALPRFFPFSQRAEVRRATHETYHWKHLADRYAPLYPPPPEGTYTHAPF